MDPVGDGVQLRDRLLAAGMTDRELRGLCRAGTLARVRPGAYVRTGPGGPDPADPVGRHRPAVHAAARKLAGGAVISHVSAAVLHGLPLWFPPPGDRVQATRDRRSGARRSAFLDLHAAAMEPDEVVVVDGLLVTSVARTVVDVARTMPFEYALVPADAALHRHLVTSAALAEVLERGSRRPGGPAARRVARSPTAGPRARGRPAAGWRSTAPACPPRPCSTRSAPGTGGPTGWTSGGRPPARSASSTAG